jgi:hypothetical protein
VSAMQSALHARPFNRPPHRPPHHHNHWMLCAKIYCLSRACLTDSSRLLCW